MDKIAQQKAMKILLALTGLQLMLNFEKNTYHPLSVRKKVSGDVRKKSGCLGGTYQKVEDHL